MKFQDISARDCRPAFRFLLQALACDHVMQSKTSRTMRGPGVVLALCALAVLPQACAASVASPPRTFYVALNGSYSNDGLSAGRAWPSLSKVSTVCCLSLRGRCRC